MSQTAETANARGTNRVREKSAADYSLQFHSLAIAHFDISLSIRKTARHMRVAPSVINEILHLRNLRRPVASAVSAEPMRKGAAA